MTFKTEFQACYPTHFALILEKPQRGWGTKCMRPVEKCRGAAQCEASCTVSLTAVEWDREPEVAVMVNE
jgi:hypothetical protein